MLRTPKNQLEDNPVCTSPEDDLPECRIKKSLKKREKIARKLQLAATVYQTLQQDVEQEECLQDLMLLRGPSEKLDDQLVESETKVAEAGQAASSNNKDDLVELLKDNFKRSEPAEKNAAEKEAKILAAEKARLQGKPDKRKIVEAEEERKEESRFLAEVARRQRLFGITYLPNTVITRSQIKEALKRIMPQDIDVYSLRTLLLCYLKLPKKLFFTNQMLKDDHHQTKSDAIRMLHDISTLKSGYVDMEPKHLRCLIDSSGVPGSLLKKIVRKFYLIPELHGFRQAVIQNCKRRKDYTFEMKDDMDPDRTISVGILDAKHNQADSYRKLSMSCISV